MGDHPLRPGLDLLGGVGLLLMLVGAAAYALLLALTHDRGWPRWRTAAWLIGSVVAAGAVLGPLATAAHTGYPAHMVVHLLLGMAAPVLFALAAPLTLLLRALPVRRARRVSHLLSSRPLRVLTEPVVAAVLVVAGMGVLYATPLYAAMHRHPLLHLAVHVHLFAAGYLFTVAIVGRDPMPHRRGYGHRSVVLVLSLAAHDIAAKYLYAHPPVAVDAPAAHLGAMIMYYGGDVVDVILMVLLGTRWYRSSGRRSFGPSSVQLPHPPARNLVRCRPQPGWK